MVKLKEVVSKDVMDYRVWRTSNQRRLSKTYNKTQYIHLFIKRIRFDDNYKNVDAEDN